jgi:biotin operon repressor
MNVTVDSLTVKLLESRYGITRSNVYNRVAGLKRKGYAMESEKLEDGRAVSMLSKSP